MKIVTTALVVICSALTIPSTAFAHDAGTWQHKNSFLRAKFKALGGDPGCNLVRGDCRGKKVNGKNVRKYFAVMRRGIMPRAAVRYVNYGAPRQAPAGGETARATGAPLSAIRQCESGGNYSTNTGNGFYGAYQFTLDTWASVGGSGNPAAASPAEQDKRAAILYSQRGSQPWPVCGQ